jgi:rRNA maturation endonuclease Nob1
MRCAQCQLEIRDTDDTAKFCEACGSSRLLACNR